VKWRLLRPSRADLLSVEESWTWHTGEAGVAHGVLGCGGQCSRGRSASASASAVLFGLVSVASKQTGVLKDVPVRWLQQWRRW